MTDMAHLVAQLVVTRAPPDTLLVLAQTSKLMRDVCYAEWRSRPRFDVPTHAPTRDMRVSKTSALKAYRLTEEDLSVLHSVRGVHPVYKNNITHYHPQAVFLLACAKHGGPRHARRGSKGSKTQDARAALWAKQNVVTSILEHSRCVAPFLANGKGGVRGVQERLARYRAFPPNALVPRDMFESYLDGQMALEDIKAVSDRASRLVACLAAHNVKLRDDSRLCQAFIRHGTGCPVEIAKTMEEMHFLHTQTSYPKIFGEMLRDHIRSRFGWLPYDEYREAAEAVRDEVSARAKAAVLARLRQPNSRRGGAS